MQIFVFILLSIIWGTTWVAIKVSLEGIPPFLGAALRFVIAILFLLIYSRLKNISLRF
ncbi:MAG: EamA family transporter, partial [Calditrichia bacterium]